MSRPSISCTVLAALCAVTACAPADSGSDTVSPAASPSGAAAAAVPAAADPAKWAGKWVGSEGLFVEIAPTAGGTFALTMQSDLDTKGSYTGKAVDGSLSSAAVSNCCCGQHRARRRASNISPTNRTA